MKKNNYMKPLCSMVEVRSELHLLSVSNEGEYRPKTDACGNIENATSIDELIRGGKKNENGNSCDETCPTTFSFSK